MPEQSRDRLPVHPARLRHMPVSVERLGDPQPHEIVEQCIARSGVASDQIVAVNVGDVGDAADIEDRDRRLEPEPPRQRAMIHRRERRAFSAGGDVGGAEVIDNWNAEPGCEHAAVADLNRQPALGPMQHGLAVEPDHGDVARPNTIGGKNVATASTCALFTAASAAAMISGRALRSVIFSATAVALRINARSGVEYER
jgi:hypothetical protein